MGEPTNVTNEVIRFITLIDENNFTSSIISLCIATLGAELCMRHINEGDTDAELEDAASNWQKQILETAYLSIAANKRKEGKLI